MRKNISMNLASSLSHLITPFISVSGIRSSSHILSLTRPRFIILFLYHVTGCRNPCNINSSVLWGEPRKREKFYYYITNKTVSRELEKTQDPWTAKVTTVVSRDSLLPGCWRHFQIRDKRGASFLKIPLGKKRFEVGYSANTKKFGKRFK